MSQYGEHLHLTIFGQSHAPAIGMTLEGLPAGETWRIRKEETVRRLETASREEKILVLADKLSNLRSLYQGELAAGDTLWQRFHQKDKGQHRWYYESIGARLGELAGTAAYQEYRALLTRVFGE